MSILLIAGSPSEHSRSAALLDAVQERIGDRVLVKRLNIRDLSPQALLLADTNHESIAHALDLVASARALVIATPIYKAAYSGVLKVFLDLLPQTALKGKWVLPMATGGSPHHMLAIDYALRPVLQSLSASHVLTSIYATDAQLPKDERGQYQVGSEITVRLDEAVKTLSKEILQTPIADGFSTVPFAPVLCSA